VRETVRAVAYQHGLIASFAPKPFPDQAGSGCHVHLSLWTGDRDALHDADRALGLSTIGRAFIGGVLDHLPARWR
jgi:glutamine synthetase